MTLSPSTVCVACVKHVSCRIFLGGHFTSTIGGFGGHFPGRRTLVMSQKVTTSALATVRLFFGTRMNQIERGDWKQIEGIRRNVIAFVIGW